MMLEFLSFSFVFCRGILRKVLHNIHIFRFLLRHLSIHVAFIDQRYHSIGLGLHDVFLHP